MHKDSHGSNHELLTEDSNVIAQIVRSGGVGVLPTDTLYGIVGSALQREVVEKIYALRKRSTHKPMIILIHALDDLKLFSIALSEDTRKTLEKLWPDKVSVVLPCNDEALHYLHRGTHSLAFRMPKDTWLQALLKETGPLVAPSANFEGEEPAATIAQAKHYFDALDFYVDSGELRGEPSTLVAFEHGTMVVKRQGAVTLKKTL